MEKNELELIKERAKDFINKMGFACEVETKEKEVDNNKEIICNISTKDDSNLLIGQNGINLMAIQHLLRMIVRKEIDDKINFVVDINFYRQQKSQSIIEQAKEAAKQAVTEKRAVVMKPMTAYERRLVHMELSKIDTIVTESIGEGEDRKVVIKPASGF